MLKTPLRAAVLALVAGALSSPVTAQPAVEHMVSQTQQVREAQLGIMKYMSTLVPAMAVRVSWADCGEPNARYDDGTIILCNESLNNRSHAIFQAAHEMGHAIVDYLGLPIDSDAKASERAADELAALAMIDAGLDDELQDTAMYYAHLWRTYVAQHDPHPDFATRGWELMCLQAGSEASSPACTVLYQNVRARWVMTYALVTMLQ